MPLFGFGILGFLGSLLSLLLNETSGKPLEDELKDDYQPRKGGNKINPIIISIIDNSNSPQGWNDDEMDQNFNWISTLNNNNHAEKNKKKRSTSI